MGNSDKKRKVIIESREKKIRWFLAVILFLIVFISLFLRISDIFRKKHTEADMVHSLYYLDENSIDVLAVGSSHLYYAFSPNKIWGDSGITSFMLGEPAQTIPISYYLLREALQYQKPKVVLLDAYNFYYDDFSNSDEHLRMALDNMKLFHGFILNMNKVEAIAAALPESSWQKKMTYLIPFSEYHARWNSLSQNDFTPEDGKWMHGGRITFQNQVYEEPPKIETQEVKISSLGIQYLEKIKELCARNGIELVLCFLPIAYEKKDYYQEVQDMNVSLKKYLKEQNITFLDVQESCQESIDYGQDFYDHGHVNYYGQMKLTESIETYLNEEFQLEDHRNDIRYKDWNEQYAVYLEYIKNAKDGDDTEDAEGAEA